MTEHYKNIVIGSGEGGKYLAWHLAQAGEQTAVVERRWIGGSCPNMSSEQERHLECQSRESRPSREQIWS